MALCCHSVLTGSYTMETLDPKYLTGETLIIEYKDDNHDGFNDNKIIESAVAMANSNGGKIFVGVTDKGIVKGSRRLNEEYWQSVQSIEAIILQNTRPNLMTKSSELVHEGLRVVCIEVPAASTTVGTNSGKYLKRRIDSKGSPINLPMNAEEIASGVSTVGATDFSANHLLGCTLEELDLELVEETSKKLLKQYQLSRDEKEIAFFNQSPENVLKGLGMLNRKGEPNIGAVLLFGKVETIRNRLPQAFIQYQVFSTRGELLKNERYTEPMARLIPLLLSLPELNRNSDEFTYRGTSVVIPEYSAEAMREAIANALVHRDYTFPNSIQIQVYGHELMVTSPGGFPQGVTIEKLLSVPPSPRNRRLAEALYRLKFVESSGRGIDFIYFGQARYGRPAPDYQGSTNDSVSVRLVGGKANLDFCKIILTLNDSLSINEMLLLNSMYSNRDLTLSEASRTIQIHESQTKEILMNMHRNGLVELVNDGEERYFLKGSISPFARKATSPKRLSTTEKKKFSDLIIAALKRRKSLSRASLADSVGLSEPQCYRLIRELTEKGKIRQTSDKKWELVEQKEGRNNAIISLKT